VLLCSIAAVKANHLPLMYQKGVSPCICAKTLEVAFRARLRNAAQARSAGKGFCTYARTDPFKTLFIFCESFSVTKPFSLRITSTCRSPLSRQSGWEKNYRKHRFYQHQIIVPNRLRLGDCIRIGEADDQNVGGSSYNGVQRPPSFKVSIRSKRTEARDTNGCKEDQVQLH
jgi:hypothetical protein